MLSVTEVAELVGMTPTGVRVALNRRRTAVGVLNSRPELARANVSLLRKGIIPEPDVRVGNSPGWSELPILRWRAYREGGELAARLESAFLAATDPEVEVLLLSLLRYPATHEFSEELVSALSAEREV